MYQTWIKSIETKLGLQFPTFLLTSFLSKMKIFNDSNTSTRADPEDVIQKDEAENIFGESAHPQHINILAVIVQHHSKDDYL